MWSTLFWLIVVFSLVYALLLFFTRFWRGYYKIERRCDVTHFATTTDGWRLALHRYIPDNPRKGTAPVLLCHGLGGNSNSFDFAPEASLATTLRDKGWDTWTLDLRGAGMSTKPSLWGRFRFDYDFFDYLEKDLTAAIDHVKEATGSSQVTWVGHSMGGMLIYALLQGDRAGDIRSAVAIASPGRLDQYGALTGFAGLLKLFPAFWLGRITKASAPLFNYSSLILALTGLRKENLIPGTGAVSAANNQNDVPMRLILQFGQWVQSDADAHGDGYAGFKAHLDKITTPMQFIVGAGDRTALPKTVEYVYERVSSKDKQLHIIGKKEGFLCDYDHLDILIGKHASQDLYPVIEEWLEGH